MAKKVASKKAARKKSAGKSVSVKKPKRASAGTKSATRKAAAKPTKKTDGAKKASRSIAKTSASSINNSPRVKKNTQPKQVKTRLSDEDLNEFRQALLAKRHDLVGDVNNLQNEASRQGSSGESAGSSSMPIHMADLGSDTWEQELTLGLIENERSLLREIDEALERIESRTYGICIATSRVITKSRLRAKPWAKYCIDHARKREQGLV